MFCDFMTPVWAETNMILMRREQKKGFFLVIVQHFFNNNAVKQRAPGRHRAE